jgi:hypothetical protein
VLDVRSFLKGFQGASLGRAESTRKNGRIHHEADPPCELKAGDVRGLQTLGSGGHFKLNSLTFVQRLVAVSLDSGEMNEDVLTGLALNETKALAGIKPLYCSLFFHLVFLF